MPEKTIKRGWRIVTPRSPQMTALLFSTVAKLVEALKRSTPGERKARAEKESPAFRP
jgi:hypothetical protein